MECDLCFISFNGGQVRHQGSNTPLMYYYKGPVKTILYHIGDFWSQSNINIVLVSVPSRMAMLVH